ncbi:tetratricopeptide repeat protein [Nocardia sp. SYP-A9097]|uniref:tetratricopeptide repeat protein n=1 Tax=Nocardia sp. SYP-A9097 TaxID=2663237 RepID=UPI00129B7520|nr:tetratricopeptide repeat protein [Nocardia sp. SYP-A9097]MRH87656.1 tetratricopeptide repeat protein [Nocardia sp. SYP-A9097]
MEPQYLSGESHPDWNSIAQDYLDRGDGFQAHMAAQEATHQRPGDAEAWYIRAQASLELDNGNDALFEITEAIRLCSDDPRFHCVLGDIHCGARDWVRARAAYERAQALDPRSPLYAIGIANTYVDNLEMAIPIYEKSVREYPDNVYFREQLAAALVESITDEWSEYADGGRGITSQAQLDFSRQVLKRIAGLDLRTAEFADVCTHIAEIQRLVDRAAQVRWYGSDHIVAYLVATSVCVLTFLIAVGAGAGGPAVLGLLGVAAIVTCYVLRHRMPDWKWTRRSVSQSVSRTGRQDPDR